MAAQGLPDAKHTFGVREAYVWCTEEYASHTAMTRRRDGAQERLLR
jgi:hypothetical protein